MNTCYDIRIKMNRFKNTSVWSLTKKADKACSTSLWENSWNEEIMLLSPYVLLSFICTLCFRKNATSQYFLNNWVKKDPILIIFGTQTTEDI